MRKDIVVTMNISRRFTAADEVAYSAFGLAIRFLEEYNGNIPLHEKFLEFISILNQSVLDIINFICLFSI